MKASKFTEAQKAFTLKQGEQGTPVAEICRKAGISQATYFHWSAGGQRKASSGRFYRQTSTAACRRMRCGGLGRLRTRTAD